MSLQIQTQTRDFMSSDPLIWLFGLEQFGIKFGLDNIARHRRGARPSRASVPLGARRRHQRQGLGDGHGRRRAARRRPPIRALHLAPSRRSDRALRHRRRPVAARRSAAVVADVRDRDRRLRDGGALDAHPTFFEVTTAVAFELFRRAPVESRSARSGSAGGSMRPTCSTRW